MQRWLWTAAHWVSSNHRTDFCELREMFFVFALINIYFSQGCIFLLHFHSTGKPEAFCFLSHFLVWVFSSTGFIMLIFDFRNIAQITLGLFFWSLFCLSWLKLYSSGLTWQTARWEFNPSNSRSAEMQGQHRQGIPMWKRNKSLSSEAVQLVVALPLYPNPPMVTAVQTIAKFGLFFSAYIFWIQHWKERKSPKG